MTVSLQRNTTTVTVRFLSVSWSRWFIVVVLFLSCSNSNRNSCPWVAGQPNDSNNDTTTTNNGTTATVDNLVISENITSSNITIPPINGTMSPTSPPSQSACALTIGADNDTCASLLGPVTVICDCYGFCNGKLIECLDFGETSPYSCSGITVAGCTRDQRITAGNETLVVVATDGTNTSEINIDNTTTPESDNPQQEQDLFPAGNSTSIEEPAQPEDDSNNTDEDEKCAVSVNARNEVCGKYLAFLPADVYQCQCFNFCNGKLIGCLEFGQKTTFSCTGETVAGCLEEQRQFSPNTGASAAMTTHLTTAISTVSAMMGVVAILLLAP